MFTEFALWGRPAGQTDALQEIVLTCTTSPERIEAVKLLAAKDGFHTFRIQVLDGTLPNFSNVQNR